MNAVTARARALIEEFKGEAYAFGPGAVASAGRLAARLGRRFLLVVGRSGGANGMRDGLRDAFRAAGLAIVDECPGAAPNSPLEDVERVRDRILAVRPDAVVGLGGGSLIDALKASVALACLGGRCDDYYGVGRVSARMRAEGKALMPHLAVMTAAASAAHLTKYANVTDMATFQKRLLIDEALVPCAAIFDYRATATMSPGFTRIGAFDGICHLLEVYFGMDPGHALFPRVTEVALTGLELIVSALPRVLDDPGSQPMREAMGLGTDLGGYAIMMGSTNGPHLNSFSLVDLMDHGAATALLVPYYTCFFAPAIEEKLRNVGRVYRAHGLLEDGADLDALAGMDLGMAVSGAMLTMARQAGLPTALNEVDGFGPQHVERMLSAAREPGLASKLAAMPIPMTAGDVERYMRPLLEAAALGDRSLIVPPRT
ncbi:MAG: iron-containing alcohol dehydrogenase [Candidatus Brocadiaceae bacterium]|nr:iron-containing alcohol dehydrogenase [Candidatus Brocadiaceae bacterium]